MCEHAARPPILPVPKPTDLHWNTWSKAARIEYALCRNYLEIRSEENLTVLQHFSVFFSASLQTSPVKVNGFLLCTGKLQRATIRSDGQTTLR